MLGDSSLVGQAGPSGATGQLLNRGSEMANVASTESILTTSVRNLDKQIASLEEIANILFQRLKPVRNERPEVSNQKTEAPRAPKSPLAGGLDVFSSRILNVKEAINSVLKEIDL